MNQVDWVGGVKQRELKDIRNTRPTIAEEKAVVVKELRDMLLRMPPTFKDWPVNTVRDWRRAADECKKVAANSRASVAELRAAIGRMEPYWK